MINSICVVGSLGNIGNKHKNKLHQNELCASAESIHSSDLITIYEYDTSYKIIGVSNDPNKIKSSDAIIIATPSSTHYEIAKTAIENGQHVLIEKPVTLSYEQAQTLYRLAQTYNVVFYTGHCYRYLPQFRENLPELFHTPMLDFKLFVKHDKPLSEAVFDLGTHGFEIAFFLGDQQKGRNFKLKSIHINETLNQIDIEANVGSKHCKFTVGYNQEEDIRILKGYNTKGEVESFVDFHSADGQSPDAMENLHSAFIKACNVGINTNEAEWAVAAVQLAEQVQNQLFPKVN